LLADDAEHEQAVGAKAVLFPQQNPELDRHTVRLQTGSDGLGLSEGKDLVALAVEEQHRS
jgi:hypothetical protein